MKEKLVNKIVTVVISVLAFLLFIIVLNFSIHAYNTKRFNSKTHTLDRSETSDAVTVEDKVTGVWPKADAVVNNVTNGKTYSVTVTNKKNYKIASWTLKMTITKECYLNQAWNGIVEIHQGVNSGNEKVDTLDLHEFDFDYDKLSIETKGQGSNELMIHLNVGDYIIYHPSHNAAAHETPLTASNNSTTIGFIFYYDTTLQSPTYELTYQFGKSIFQGTEYVIFLVLSVIWGLIFSGSMVWTYMRHKSLKELKDREIMLQETMGLITSFVDAKDTYTHGHSTRVAQYTRLLANRLGMHKNDINYAYYAAILHDVGKCYVPDEILKKPGRLTNEEFDIIKKHTTYGGDMLKSIKSIKSISDGAKYHHERYDGKGYPEGLSGENIPYIGRIICVADAFDAMTSSRCYRDALSKEYVLNELKNNLGKQFDPVIGQAMIDLINEETIVIESWKK